MTVVVRHVARGKPVTVTLEQKRGPRPFVPAQSTDCRVGEGGTAFAAFQVALSAGEGGSSAVLVATARNDKGTCFCADGTSIEIV